MRLYAYVLIYNNEIIRRFAHSDYRLSAIFALFADIL